MVFKYIFISLFITTVSGKYFRPSPADTCPYVQCYAPGDCGGGGSFCSCDTSGGMPAGMCTDMRERNITIKN